MIAITCLPLPRPATLPEKSDKVALNPVSSNRSSRGPVPVVSSGVRLKNMPAFIPLNGRDRQFSVVNPGWERYKEGVREFRVLHEAQTIKAIQMVDRSGQGVPESYLRAVLGQVTKSPDYSIDSSEKKEGYEIQRGRIAENIKAVYYRYETSGKLQAFTLTWQ